MQREQIRDYDSDLFLHSGRTALSYYPPTIHHHIVENLQVWVGNENRLLIFAVFLISAYIHWSFKLLLTNLHKYTPNYGGQTQ